MFVSRVPVKDGPLCLEVSVSVLILNSLLVNAEDVFYKYCVQNLGHLCRYNKGYLSRYGRQQNSTKSM